MFFTGVLNCDPIMTIQVNELGHLPVVLCGDFNGRISGRVYQYLEEKGFKCAYEEALHPGSDCGTWITHRNHLGEELGVDYVWFINPEMRTGPLEHGWEKIVYQSTKRQLLSSSYRKEKDEDDESMRWR
ncbi:unnamed protein product, partial [Choristocarpus tenellus]